MQAIDQTGKVFGSYKVLGKTPVEKKPGQRSGAVWRVQCVNCGYINDVQSSNLKLLRQHQCSFKHKDYVEGAEPCPYNEAVQCAFTSEEKCNRCGWKKQYMKQGEHNDG